MPESLVYNVDCLTFMKVLPDKAFELAITDPPYGISIISSGSVGGSNSKHPAKKYRKSEWDSCIPEDKYFNELERISTNQIIWGANHFGLKSSCWIVWDKLTTGNFSDCELAYTSFEGAVRKFTYMWNGFQQGELKNTIEKRIHPTQKPVALYKWLLKNYAKPGDRIFDSHGGSMSSVIACLEMGHSITCCEKDPDYYKAAKKRIQNYLGQQKLFDTHGSVQFIDNISVDEIL